MNLTATSATSLEQAQRIVRLCREPQPGEVESVDTHDDRRSVAALAERYEAEEGMEPDAALAEARAWVVKNIIDRVY